MTSAQPKTVVDQHYFQWVETTTHPFANQPKHFAAASVCSLKLTLVFDSYDNQCNDEPKETAWPRCF